MKAEDRKTITGQTGRVSWRGREICEKLNLLAIAISPDWAERTGQVILPYPPWQVPPLSIRDWSDTLRQYTRDSTPTIHEELPHEIRCIKI